jgi:hypothetical protein
MVFAFPNGSVKEFRMAELMSRDYLETVKSYFFQQVCKNSWAHIMNNAVPFQIT